MAHDASELRPRFERLWVEWDRLIEAGRNPVDLLRELLDDDILRLLASGGDARRYEHDILMTELHNRLVRAQRELDAATEAVVLVNERIREHIAKGQTLADESLVADARLVRHRDEVQSRSWHAKRVRDERDERGESRIQ